MATSRREFIGQAAKLLALAAVMETGAFPGSAGAVERYGPLSEFPDDFVRTLARNLAARPFVDEAIEMPDGFDVSTYDQYRDIRFNPERSVWSGEDHKFSFDLFHSGFIFTRPVDIYVVEDGRQAKLNYDPRLFIFGPRVEAPPDGIDLHYAGFRVRYPINDPNVNDEFLVFQGASYFRAVGRGLLYGLSARGLAIDTGQASGEEFPFFRSFWIRRPEVSTGIIVIEALLDSPSVAGAYRFSVRPGDDTEMDVELTLFPRRDLANVGIAPLTSMFLFNALDRRVDDYRNAVHDSDGLMMLAGTGEWIWRPLANPGTLQVSAFQDRNPRGFGLMQRTRRYDDFLDLESRYERRPSLWVEPIGDWGAGFVALFEIPTQLETNDNIVAYWQPAEPMLEGGSYSYVYRLHWCESWPKKPAASVGLVTFSGSGVDYDYAADPPRYDPNLRLYVIEFEGGPAAGELEAAVTASAGTIGEVVVYPNEIRNTTRLSFAHDATGVDLAEFRAMLRRGGVAAGETWLFRWTRS